MPRCSRGSVTITGRSFPDKFRNPSAAGSTEAFRWPDREAFQGQSRLLEELADCNQTGASSHQEQRPSAEPGRGPGVWMGELREKEENTVFPSERKWRST